MSVYSVSIVQKPSDLFAAAVGDEQELLDWIDDIRQHEARLPEHQEICDWIDSRHVNGAHIEVRRVEAGLVVAFASPEFTETDVLDDVGEVLASTAGEVPA